MAIINAYFDGSTSGAWEIAANWQDETGGAIAVPGSGGGTWHVYLHWNLPAGGNPALACTTGPTAGKIIASMDVSTEYSGFLLNPTLNLNNNLTIEGDFTNDGSSFSNFIVSGNCTFNNAAGVGNGIGITVGGNFSASGFDGTDEFTGIEVLTGDTSIGNCGASSGTFGSSSNDSYSIEFATMPIDNSTIVNATATLDDLDGTNIDGTFNGPTTLGAAITNTIVAGTFNGTLNIQCGSLTISTLTCASTVTITGANNIINSGDYSGNVDLGNNTISGGTFDGTIYANHTGSNVTAITAGTGHVEVTANCTIGSGAYDTLPVYLMTRSISVTDGTGDTMPVGARIPFAPAIIGGFIAQTDNG